MTAVSHAVCHAFGSSREQNFANRIERHGSTRISFKSWLQRGYVQEGLGVALEELASKHVSEKRILKCKKWLPIKADHKEYDCEKPREFHYFLCESQERSYPKPH
ncbi:hypothetical protein Y032_0012g1848 [Ancylostoma ceylanicum]|uniref:Uncharacterized protein n=1 Tax=Ancylostoma ceylanicum TaxID=53326 RepID=A0A016VE97_9BILA|nr:hypothetical protein Y032_0012g1848 [Ancylostoma ceylanicum]